jgi:sugar phosphate isomerase/epimerase
MRLGISGIAWDPAEDATIAGLLRRYAIDAIDVVPGKYFPDPAQATREEVHKVRDWWRGQGMEITGMQALLFGTAGLNIFGPAESREAMLQRLAAVCRIGGLLGARRLAFGSPKNRDRTGLGDRETLDIAVAFFRRLGDTAQAHDVSVCLEPNPPCYGGNFMLDTVETAQVVAATGHPGILLQYDTGAATINQEDPASMLEQCWRLVGHCHASEPDLLPLGDGSTDHARQAAAISLHDPDCLITIEMLATKAEPHAASIERAVKVAHEHYRGVGA